MKPNRALWPVIITAHGLLFCAAAFDHFHDGPPPDLSRFHRPEHDPAAFAEVKRLTDRFASEFKEYKPVETGDPDDFPADDEHTLDYLAIHGDADALRTLRRYLKENAAALRTAHELVSLQKIAQQPLATGNMMMTSFVIQQSFKNSFKLLYLGSILAGEEKRTNEEWKTAEIMLSFSERQTAASGMLIQSLTGLACENIAISTGQLLASHESDPKDIRLYLLKSTHLRPDPLRFRDVYAAEIMAIADSIMPSRGGKLLQVGSGPGPSYSWKELSEKPLEAFREWWLGINMLPNTTTENIATLFDEECSNLTLVSKPRTASPKWGLWLLAKNSGGIPFIETLGGALPRLRVYFFTPTARYDLTRLALAIRVHALEHDGKLPATLAELTPGILSSQPDDVFAPGHAYHYDATTGKLWSVGPDGIDGGGDENSDIVVKPGVASRP